MTAAAVIPVLDSWAGRARVHRYFVCDVFTSRPLAGNQLGVFADGRAFSPGEMQRLARELNYAETVFLLPPENGGDVRMRIFTPSPPELQFAGHPVLGTAFVVGEALGSEAVALETGLGVIRVELERDSGRIVFGRMSQPIPAWEPFGSERQLLAALGADTSTLPIEFYRIGPGHVFVGFASGEEVAALRPDMGLLAELGVAANCFAAEGSRVRTRMFYPAGGIPEDPATGSAAGPLAVHLARHGRIAFGQQITVRQGEEIGRPSLLYATARGQSPDRIESVEVGGAAMIVASGQFRIAID